MIAPYPLRKIEAILSKEGFKTWVVSPEHISQVLKREGAYVVGVSTHDPLGIEPVSLKLSMIFGGGETWTAKFFRELIEKLSNLKKFISFKILVGGPGAWQLINDSRYDSIDVIFIGEAERTLPRIIEKIISGDEIPRVIRGETPSIEEIPPIINPARLGEVQITRGCPRGCWFCSVTPETFRSFPLEIIKREIEINLKHGIRRVEFLTDDLLLYGSEKLRVNHDALVKLFTETMRMGAEGIWFPHISAAPVRESPKTIKAISEIAGYNRDRVVSPVVGLETGSVKILKKYMRAKVYPWRPEEWRDMIIDATIIMNDNYIYPCYTMTIGYPEETDQDVEESIKLVESIIDHGFKAWIFPLPLVPIATTRIRDYPLPTIERLPSRYWDLLYISWRYNLRITRELIPNLTAGVKSRLVKKIISHMIDKVFSSIEWIFKELKETKGLRSLEFSTINLDNISGLIRSIYWLIKISFRRT